MTTVSLTLHSTLTQPELMRVLTDFGPARPAAWPSIDADHFVVHDRGERWAEVTEGNAMGWERERYSWDTAAGTVTIDTLDSNLWGVGSSWRYRLIPAGDGTDVNVALTRVPKGVRGRLVGALIPFAGPRLLAKQFRTVLQAAERS